MKSITRKLRHLLHDLLMLIIPSFLRKKMMLSCSEITQIIATNEQMSFVKKMKLKSHLIICLCCSDYSDQLLMISKNCKKIKAPELTKAQLDMIKNKENSFIEEICKDSK